MERDSFDLRRQRRALDLSQEELGDFLGVSVNTISRWETGALMIRHPRMLRLAIDTIAGLLERGTPRIWCAVCHAPSVLDTYQRPFTCGQCGVHSYQLVKETT